MSVLLSIAQQNILCLHLHLRSMNKDPHLKCDCAQHSCVSCVTHRVQVIGIQFASSCHCIEGQEEADGPIHHSRDNCILPESGSREGRAVVVHLGEAYECCESNLRQIVSFLELSGDKCHHMLCQMAGTQSLSIHRTIENV